MVYYLAYIKANFFKEVMIELMNHKKGIFLLKCLQETQILNFEVKKPNINYSQIGWSLIKRKIFIMGFSSLKDYDEILFKKIVRERNINGEYRDLKDFLMRSFEIWNDHNIMKLKNWIKFGIFDDILDKNLNLNSNFEGITLYLKTINFNFQ